MSDVLNAQASVMERVEWLHYQASKSVPHSLNDCELCDAVEEVRAYVMAAEARAVAAERERDAIQEKFDHLHSEWGYGHARGDHLVYEAEWEAFDAWQRSQAGVLHSAEATAEAEPKCPFCLFLPASRDELATHLDDCSGRLGYGGAAVRAGGNAADLAECLKFAQAEYHAHTHSMEINFYRCSEPRCVAAREALATLEPAEAENP